MNRNKYIKGETGNVFKWVKEDNITSCKPDKDTEIRCIENLNRTWTLTGWYKHNHVLLRQSKYHSVEAAQADAKEFYYKEIGYYRKKYDE
jgi:hypothetical protein